METFSGQWFTLYYGALSFLLLFSGGYLLIYHKKARIYLLGQADNDRPPSLLKTILKYLFLFTIPCLILSFIPFSWIELLFSVWSLIIVFVAGLQLVRWSQIRHLIKENPDRMEFLIRLMGALMMALSPAILLLSYRTLTRIS